MEGSQRPRRALGPVPDDWSEPSDSSSASPAGPLFDDPELTDTGMMRRLALNSDGSLQTLIPPPRPVLPVSEAQPASAGRRFSADDAPTDHGWAAPRRSAVSVSSPPRVYAPLLPPVSRPTAPPAVTVSYPRAAEPVEAPAVPVAPVSATSTRSGLSARSQATPPLRAVEPEPKLTRREARAAAAQAKVDAKAALEAEKAATKEAALQAKLDARSAKADAKAAKRAPKADKNGIDPAARLGVTPTQPARGESTPRQRSGRPAFIVIAAVLAFALVVAAVVWVMTTKPLGSASDTSTAAIDPLLTTAEVSPIAAEDWQVATAAGTPLCLTGATPQPERTTNRKLFTAQGSSVLQTIGTYPDDASAIQAYEAQATLAGTCPDGSALVVGASTINGLADNAQAVQLKVQAVKAENHLLVLARTGRTINTFDIVTANTIPVTTAAQVAAISLARQCGSGTCPASIGVASALPASGTPAGWLLPADVPRLTPGTGKWTLHDWPVNTPGSQCEGTDLTKVSGTTASGQRTLILTNDSKAPASFGVDQVTFTFADNKAASTLATSVSKSITNCAKRVPTAVVVDGESVKGSGQGEVPISGQTWTITHKTNTSTVVFRVAVVTVGNRVTYLLANPSKTFDFSDADWDAITLRAAQRTSQAS